jgi:hypothetical protein
LKAGISIIDTVSVGPQDKKRSYLAWWPAVVSVATLMGMVCALILHTSKSVAKEYSYSLRFYGHGVGDIDRVKIQIDPPVPADLGATDFTIEWWMKAHLEENASPSCAPGGDNWIFGNIVLDRDIWGPGDYGDYGISLAGGRIAFGINNGENAETACGSILVADGRWHHVAVTRRYGDGLMRIFVDGQLDREVDGPDGDVSYRDGRGTGYEDDPFLVIGAEKHDAGPEYPSYSGWIDEVRVSDVIRYTSGFEPPSAPFISDGNTVALYHLDEGPVGACTGTVLDSSGASGGPSNGTCNYGGTDPAGPVYAADIPFIQDTSPPSISNVAASPLAAEAIITWDTDEPATSRVTYGVSPTLNLSTTESVEYVTSHRIVLVDLSPDIDYAYAVRSVDEVGNAAVSAVFSFRTFASEDVKQVYLPLVLRTYRNTEAEGRLSQRVAVGFASAAALIGVVAIGVRRGARIRRSQNATLGTVKENARVSARESV